MRVLFARKIQSRRNYVKTRFAVSLAMIAGFGLGILADQPLNAQTIPLLAQ
jgi:hypothetical protein